MDSRPYTTERRTALLAVAAVAESFGHGVIFLDRRFRITYASPLAVATLGANARPLEGRPVGELLDQELFGSGELLLDSLERGERREGWITSAALPDGTNREIACTATPLTSGYSIFPGVSYVMFVRRSSAASASDELRRSHRTIAQLSEAEAIRAALEAHHWNRDATARALGIGRTTLWRKMREVGLGR